MHYPGMQSAGDAINSADTQNLIASIADILQGTTAAIPPGPPLGGPTPAGAGGSPGRAAADAANAAAAAAAAASAMPNGLMLLPHQLGGIPGFPGINLNDPNLAPYLQLASMGASGLAMDPSLQQLMFAMPGQPGGLPLNSLASLLVGTGVELDPSAAADLAAGGLMGAGKQGQLAGQKRPADMAAGGAYKRERSEEAGRGREQGKCHVEGCTVDLASAGPYYQRYRTCELHLKAPYIIKDGMQQRFCQQCGRFHELSEFDNNKRSCRARLHSHNQRRRKRTEEQMANQGADGAGGGGHGGGAASGSLQAGGGLMQPGAAANLGAQMAALGAHGLLGGVGAGAPNLNDILNSMGGITPDLLASMTDPTKVAPGDLAALLSMSPALLGSLGMGAPDANAALSLALAAAGGGADALGQPLLDSIFKGAGGGAPGGGLAPGDLAGMDLQQQLAMALAGTGGAMPDQASMEAALAAAAAAMDPHALAAAAAAAGMSHHQLAGLGHHHHHQQHHHHDPMGGGGHHLGGHHGDGSM